jgi:UDP-N-acetylglucosamine 1-carboxyvinyltransferase
MSTIEGRDTLVIRGGRPLNGSVLTNGSKNAVLGAMAATLLVPELCRLTNVPRIADVDRMAGVLRSLGAKVDWDGDRALVVDPSGLSTSRPDRELAESLRGSFAIMGALLSRLGEAACPPPGGDVIGLRPVDVHLKGFEALGAEVEESDEWFELRVAALKGASIFNDYPSVLGTQNLMLAAVCAEGRTTIVNAAAEPEVQGLAEMLRGMGAKIRGEGTQTIVIDGVDRLRGTEYAIIPDRLEAGTFMIAAAITGGEVEVGGARPDHLTSLVHKLREAGVEVRTDGEQIVLRAGSDLRGVSIQALPYPGFATDLQAPMAVLLTQASGVSRVMERVFDNRLLYVEELVKMGADIVTEDKTTAIISGPTLLKGASVHALDVRAGAALILAGLAANGTTQIADIHHVDRGYQAIDERLRSLGADIERV